ncbi:MAG: thioredoxin family protein [Bacteroidota bacterium]
MKKLKNIFVFVAVIVSTGFSAQSTHTVDDGLVWHTDLMKANELSTISNKPIFAFFTGSDWCGWCKKLERDVLSKPEFIQWAKKNVVLLELDFPRNKQLSPALMQQNAGLQQTFQVKGYPTIWLFFLIPNSDGVRMDIDALGSLGYPPGAEPGNEQVKFLKDANSFLEKRTLK